MTDDMMDLQALLEKSSDSDLLRDMTCFSAHRLMELEVEGRGCGSRPFNLAVPNCDCKYAALWPARSDPRYNQFFLPIATGRMQFSAAWLSIVVTAGCKFMQWGGGRRMDGSPRLQASCWQGCYWLGGLKEPAQDVDIHMEVTEQAVEGMAKGSGAVVFEEEVADPGRSIAEQG